MHLVALLLPPAAALLAPAVVPKAPPRVALRPEEVAFLDAITCDARDLRQAEALYEKYGVVRLRKAAANADLLARQATSAGVVADAFGQKCREDRYTIHLRGDARKWQGDGTDSTDDSAGDGRLEHLAPAVADWLDDAAALAARSAAIQSRSSAWPSSSCRCRAARRSAGIMMVSARRRRWPAATSPRRSGPRSSCRGSCRRTTSTAGAARRGALRPDDAPEPRRLGLSPTLRGGFNQVADAPARDGAPLRRRGRRRRLRRGGDVLTAAARTARTSRGPCPRDTVRPKPIVRSTRQ